MKTTVALHENEQWVYYPGNSSKIEHVSRITAGECFFFDPAGCSATSVVPQQATADDPRAGHLMLSFKFDEQERDWFLERPARIKGLKEFLKNMSKEDAKRYALEISALPKKEIEEKAIEFDAKSSEPDQVETKIVLQIMTSIIQSVNPEIFVIARNQRDDLIINVLKYLPKAFRKVGISMPWSSGLDLGRISITDEEELPMISRPMYVVTESSQKLISSFPEQFAVAKMLFEDNRLADENIEQSEILIFYRSYTRAVQLESKGFWNEASDVFKSEKFRNIWKKLHPYKPPQVKPGNSGTKPPAPQNPAAVSTVSRKVAEDKNITDAGPEREKNLISRFKNMQLADVLLLAACEILLLADYFYYLEHIAGPDNLISAGFLGVMTGILSCSLIFCLIDKNS